MCVCVSACVNTFTLPEETRPSREGYLSKDIAGLEMRRKKNGTTKKNHSHKGNPKRVNVLFELQRIGRTIKVI